MLVGMVYYVRVIALEKLLPGSQRNTQANRDCDYFLAMQHKYLTDIAYGDCIGLTAGNFLRKNGRFI